MCTAITLSGEKFLFGRTLDLDRSYEERVVVTPRGADLSSRLGKLEGENMAIMGIGCVREGFPLYYDGVNEKGLSMAALNFPVSAKYFPESGGKYNIPSFCLIPRVLGYCEDLSKALELLSDVNITDERFSRELPPTPLHWILSYRGKTAVVESAEQGIRIYDDPVGVLTNEPPFPMQMAFLSNFTGLSPEPPKNGIFGNTVTPCSNGTGAMGLPGDLSSSSRFVRGAFVSATAGRHEGENEISRFFHTMDNVSVPRGCVKTKDGGYMSTRYTVCYDTEAFECYFTTYDCRRIRKVTSHNLNEHKITDLPIYKGEDIEEIKIGR